MLHTFPSKILLFPIRNEEREYYSLTKISFEQTRASSERERERERDALRGRRRPPQKKSAFAKADFDRCNDDDGKVFEDATTQY